MSLPPPRSLSNKRLKIHPIHPRRPLAWLSAVPLACAPSTLRIQYTQYSAVHPATAQNNHHLVETAPHSLLLRLDPTATASVRSVALLLWYCAQATLGPHWQTGQPIVGSQLSGTPSLPSRPPPVKPVLSCATDRLAGHPISPRPICPPLWFGLVRFTFASNPASALLATFTRHRPSQP